jgi:hypothetical protein
MAVRHGFGFRVYGFGFWGLGFWVQRAIAVPSAPGGHAAADTLDMMAAEVHCTCCWELLLTRSRQDAVDVPSRNTPMSCC